MRGGFNLALPGGTLVVGFDTSPPARTVRAMLSRRRALLLAPLSVLPLGQDATTALGKKRKKTKVCLDGQTLKVPKKKKKQLLRKGARSGACKKCSGSTGCSSGDICWEGVCRTCSVTCNGDSLTCGAALNQRLSQGGTVFVCPGRYAGGFTTASVTLIGAGNGDNPATSTILDGREQERVLTTSEGATVSLSRLRITRGNSGDAPGGGVFASDGDLSIDDCVIDGNRTSGSNFAGGGGLHAEGARLTMTNSRVANNTSGFGGGMQFRGSSHVSIAATRVSTNRVFNCGAYICMGGGIASYGVPIDIRDTEIDGNISSGGGGGIMTYALLTLDAATRITNNVASVAWGGGGIYRGAGDNNVQVGGATISGNTPDNINPPL